MEYPSRVVRNLESQSVLSKVCALHEILWIILLFFLLLVFIYFAYVLFLLAL